MIWTVFFSIFGILLAVVHQFFLSPVISLAGLSYNAQNFGLNAEQCQKFEEVQACDKIVLHQATGLLYLACSTLENRVRWMPPADRYETPVEEDYVAIFDPRTSKTTRLALENFDLKKAGLAVHGMDVVPSDANPNELFIYLINHRPDPSGVGADSVIEIFKTVAGSDTLLHIRTVRDPAIIEPNDVTGFGDGKRFYFTNWRNKRGGVTSQLRAMFTSFSSLGYCSEDGCRIVVPNLYTANGITQASNGTVYVVSSHAPGILIYERQADDSLIFLEDVGCATPIDNISLDKDGVIWAAGLPKYLESIKDVTSVIPSRSVPACAWKFGLNTGSGAFYGEKYKVEKAFENDGSLVSGAKTVVHDAERSRLFMHGITTPYLTVCSI
ncbi:hypothetical protein GYMLUDRAFT_37431 [Collybiopsis luxurians FD-317 M1]|nr:hypothetical protein GYMLUDRAFT_37431 [Collybiopsis luxurians FD-317 M1]